MKRKIFITLSIIISISAFSFYHFRSKKFFDQPKENTKSVAYDGLQFLSSAAAFPNADIPPDAYGNAWDFYKSNYLNTTSGLRANVSWRSMGPQNVGGRTISIAIDPVDTNIIWLGSASGGLWKSTSGGYGINAWQYVPTGFPVLGVGGIAINPMNKNEMYIGTGETYNYGTSVNGLVIRPTRGSNGIGILKSIDGGITWTQSLNWNYNQLSGVWNIIINPQNPKTVFAATTEGVYKSTDAGATWNKCLNYLMIMDLAMDPNDTTILYAGVGNLTSPTHGLYKTSDAGAIWEQMTNGLPSSPNSGRISIDIYKKNSNIVMVNIANDFNSVGLYKTTNKGQQWNLVSSYNISSIQGWYSKCIKMNDNDSNHVFAGGVNLFESIDGGFSFTTNASYNPDLINTVPWSDCHGLISNEHDPDKIYLLTDAGLYRSNDFGIHWQWCANGYNVSQFYHGSVAAVDSNLALGGLQDRNTYRFNGSPDWVPVNGGDGTFNAIDQTDPSIQYSASQYLYIGKSVDSGYTFAPIFAGSAPAFVAPYILAPSNHLMIYAGDEYMNISNDGGISWLNSGPVDNNNAILSMDASSTDENKIYFATAPSDNFPMHVFLSLDGGFSYDNISSGLPNRYPRDIAVDPSNDSIAYIVFSGFGAGHIFKTINSGDSWTDVSINLPDVPFHSVLVDPKNPNIIFAGCDFGVFISKDAGLTWETMNEGLPMAVMVFDIQYSASDKSVVIFTHGHGVYKINLKDIDVGIQIVKTVENSFKVYPTIAKENITVEFYSQNSSAKNLLLTDAAGKIIHSQNVESFSGINKIKIDLTGLAHGIYWCKLTGKDFSLSQQVIKN